MLVAGGIVQGLAMFILLGLRLDSDFKSLRSHLQRSPGTRLELEDAGAGDDAQTGDGAPQSLATFCGFTLVLNIFWRPQLSI